SDERGDETHIRERESESSNMLGHRTRNGKARGWRYSLLHALAVGRFTTRPRVDEEVFPQDPLPMVDRYFQGGGVPFNVSSSTKGPTLFPFVSSAPIFYDTTSSTRYACGRSRSRLRHRAQCL
ncbi:unnamed protein product, partial [Ectocarpus sp. 4 AP-2014]